MITSPSTKKTIQKMMRSQAKKQEIMDYMQEHTPHLLSNPNRKQRIRDCCNVLRFVNYGKWEVKLMNANFCKYDKFCLACSTRRAIRKIQHFVQGIEKYWLEKKNWYHITLTIRHHKWHSLEESMDRIMAYKKQLGLAVRNSKRKNQKKQSFFSQFDGMVSSVEVTHWKNGRHPHIHALVCTDNDVDIKYFKKIWTKSNRQLINERYNITKDSFCVAMRKVDVSKNHFDRQGIAEVFKYAVKFSTLTTPQLVELIALQKRKQYRFYATTAIFRGRKIDKPKAKELQKLWTAENERVTKFLYEDYNYDEKGLLYRASQLSVTDNILLQDSNSTLI